MTPEALVAFFEREREALNAEEEERRALSVAELVERGDAIEGLGIVEQQLGVLVLRCTENISRLRTGDRVELHHSDCRVTGTLVELLDHGCELHIELTGKKDDLPTGLWTASALPVDVSSMIIACLERLKPGGPGWAFSRALQGEVGRRWNGRGVRHGTGRPRWSRTRPIPGGGIPPVRHLSPVCCYSGAAGDRKDSASRARR
jgi:hypothetical protein